ncbi:hypothetical protein [Streptomyces sp. NPDC088196]|uniref:hypothetical protein n=1 Tax=Streptomyces sp. NPDC088196 TaxID=3154868 RepID=UPI00344B6B92
MADSGLSELRESAFATLARVVRDWRSAGRVTTSAGVKPAFVEAMNGKTERDFEFGTWREFIEAAADAEYVRTERLTTNHTAILLPDENPVVATAELERRTTQRSNSEASPSRIRFRPDVWAAFVEWHDGHRRLWDVQTSRAFVYPVDENGSPAWESQSDRFYEIDPVGPESQKEWMREWALKQQPGDRDALLAALAPDAPLRSFRYELDARELAMEWRAELQSRVSIHVREWANQHGIAWPDLIVRVKQERPPVSANDSSHKAAGRNVRQATSVPENRSGRGARGSDLERLREIVHRAVDRMSYAELAEIPIRAEHLLGDL